MTAAVVSETEAAFWASIGEMPEDALRRLVFADWLEERAGSVECPACNGTKQLRRCTAFMYSCAEMGWECDCNSFGECHQCDGTGHTPDGRADLAAALRSTVRFVPYHLADLWWFHCRIDGYDHWPATCRLPMELNDAAGGFQSATRAIRRLCETWAAVNKEGHL